MTPGAASRSMAESGAAHFIPIQRGTTLIFQRWSHFVTHLTSLLTVPPWLRMSLLLMDALANGKST